MVPIGQQIELVDAIWATASDARWHTLEEVAKRLRSSYGRVALAVNVLEKYGFAEVSGTSERRFRINPGTISPMETVYSLRSLLHGPEPT